MTQRPPLLPCTWPRAWGATLRLGVALLCAGATLARADTELESRVKLAYLVQLSRFVTWPSPPAEGGGARICVAGEAPFSEQLNAAERWPANMRAVGLVGGVPRATDGCQVLYLGNDVALTPALLQQWQDKGMLTVSDQPAFAQRGGMVGFYLDGGRVKLLINLDATRAASLRVNARLLEVARTIGKGG